MNPIDKFIYWEKTTPNATFLRQPTGSNWKTWSFKEAGDEVRRLATGMARLDLPVGSNVALLSKNCAHWIMGDLAIMMCGYVSVPVYATLTAEPIRQILVHSEAKAIIIGKLDRYEQQKAGIPANITKIGIREYGIDEDKSWEDLVKNQPMKEPYRWKPDEVGTIVYTSGTTGVPKGVMHALSAFDVLAQNAIKELKLAHVKKMFSYLPLSHIAERSGIEIIGIYQGAEFSFAESLESFPKNLADTQPDLFFAVPRIWSKFREKIVEKMPEKKLNRLLGLPIIGSIVKKSIRKKLGLKNATRIFSGAAPLSLDMLLWFDKLGITIFQAYGMTEDCVYAHLNSVDANKFGTVGKPLSGLQVKISDEGEVRLKGPGNLKGYYKDPQLTASVFDEEGYLRTGDIGERDKEGYLTLTGRLKDQFKTDKGKYISPTPIEMKISGNPFVEMTCVVGMGIPQPIVLIMLSAQGKSKSKSELVASFSAMLSEINPTLESFEKLEKAVILKGEWTIENGLLTPSMKIKRNEVEKIHLPKYPGWYANKEMVIWE